MKKFEAQNAMHNLYYISKGGLMALKNKLTTLQQERTKLRESLRAHRDDHPANNYDERFTWSEYLHNLQFLDIEIAKTKQILAKTRLLRRPQKRDTVQLGSKVVLKVGKQHITYTIVTSLEADPSEGKISNESPFGKTLLGKKISDYIKWQFNRTSPKPARLKLVEIR